MISTKGRYALRVMIDLAVNNNSDYISLKDISARQGITIKYLEQVVSLLNRAGFLHSMRGSNGGYKLAKNPQNYTAGDILRVAEGTLAPVSCLEDSENLCPRSDTCPTINFWNGFYDTVNNYIDSITLQDLADSVYNENGGNYSI